MLKNDEDPHLECQREIGELHARLSRFRVACKAIQEALEEAYGPFNDQEKKAFYLAGQALIEDAYKPIKPEPSIKPEPYDPLGIRFIDLASGREMKLVTDGFYQGWLVYRHPDGQWVTLRKATGDDLRQIIGKVPTDKVNAKTMTYYTCNGSQKGCERERFGMCAWHEILELREAARRIILSGYEDSYVSSGQAWRDGSLLASYTLHTTSCISVTPPVEVPTNEGR